MAESEPSATKIDVTGIAVGVGVGGGAFLAIVVILVIYLCVRHQSKRKTMNCLSMDRSATYVDYASPFVHYSASNGGEHVDSIAGSSLYGTTAPQQVSLSTPAPRSAERASRSTSAPLSENEIPLYCLDLRSDHPIVVNSMTPKRDLTSTSTLPRKSAGPKFTDTMWGSLHRQTQDKVVHSSNALSPGLSKRVYPTGIVTIPGLKNEHLAVLRDSIEITEQDTDVTLSPRGSLSNYSRGSALGYQHGSPRPIFSLSDHQSSQLAVVSPPRQRLADDSRKLLKSSISAVNSLRQLMDDDQKQPQLFVSCEQLHKREVNETQPDRHAGDSLKKFAIAGHVDKKLGASHVPVDNLERRKPDHASTERGLTDGQYDEQDQSKYSGQPGEENRLAGLDKHVGKEKLAAQELHVGLEKQTAQEQHVGLEKQTAQEQHVGLEKQAAQEVHVGLDQNAGVELHVELEQHVVPGQHVGPICVTTEPQPGLLYPATDPRSSQNDGSHMSDSVFAADSSDKSNDDVFNNNDINCTNKIVEAKSYHLGVKLDGIAPLNSYDYSPVYKLDFGGPNLAPAPQTDWPAQSAATSSKKALEINIKEAEPTTALPQISISVAEYSGGQCLTPYSPSPIVSSLDSGSTNQDAPASSSMCNLYISPIDHQASEQKQVKVRFWDHVNTEDSKSIELGESENLDAVHVRLVAPEARSTLTGVIDLAAVPTDPAASKGDMSWQVRDKDNVSDSQEQSACPEPVHNHDLCSNTSEDYQDDRQHQNGRPQKMLRSDHQGQNAGMVVEAEKSPLNSSFLLSTATKYRPESELIRSSKLISTLQRSSHLVSRLPAEQLVKEQPANEQIVKKQLANELPVKEHPVSEQLVKKQPATEQLVKEQPVNRQMVKEQPGNEQLANWEPVKKRLTYDQLAKGQQTEKGSIQEQSAVEPAEEQMARKAPSKVQKVGEDPVEGQGALRRKPAAKPESAVGMEPGVHPVQKLARGEEHVADGVSPFKQRLQFFKAKDKVTASPPVGRKGSMPRCRSPLALRSPNLSQPSATRESSGLPGTSTHQARQDVLSKQTASKEVLVSSEGLSSKEGMASVVEIASKKVLASKEASSETNSSYVQNVQETFRECAISEKVFGQAEAAVCPVPEPLLAWRRVAGALLDKKRQATDIEQQQSGNVDHNEAQGRDDEPKNEMNEKSPRKQDTPNRSAISPPNPHDRLSPTEGVSSANLLTLMTPTRKPIFASSPMPSSNQRSVFQAAPSPGLSTSSASKWGLSRPVNQLVLPRVADQLAWDSSFEDIKTREATMRLILTPQPRRPVRLESGDSTPSVKHLFNGSVASSASQMSKSSLAWDNSYDALEQSAIQEQHATMMEDDISVDIPPDLFPPESPEKATAVANVITVSPPSSRNVDADTSPNLAVVGKAAIRPSDSFLTFLSDPSESP